MINSTNLRFERKFILKESRFGDLNLILKKKALGFRKAFPDRHVNSIYFDTHDFRYYCENLDGIANRHKIRIRWYGKDSETLIENPKLELKIKQGLVGTKQRHKLAGFNSKKNLNKLILELGTADIPEDTKLLMKSVLPVVLVRYTRKYFISRNNQIRLTFDDNIRYYNAGNGFIRGAGIRDQNNIVEIKYAVENDEWVEQISSNFPYRLNKNSKYVNALKTFYDVRI